MMIIKKKKTYVDYLINMVNNMKNKIITFIFVIIIAIESIMLIMVLTKNNSTPVNKLDSTTTTTIKKEEKEEPKEEVSDKETVNDKYYSYSYSVDKAEREPGWARINEFDYLKIGDRDIIKDITNNKKVDADDYWGGKFLDEIKEYFPNERSNIETKGFIMVTAGFFQDLMNYRNEYYLYDTEGNLLTKLLPIDQQNKAIIGFDVNDVTFNRLTSQLTYTYTYYSSEEGLLPDLVGYETGKNADFVSWYDERKIPKRDCNVFSKYLNTEIKSTYVMSYEDGKFSKPKKVYSLTLGQDPDYYTELSICKLWK